MNRNLVVLFKSLLFAGFCLLATLSVAQNSSIEKGKEPAPAAKPAVTVKPKALVIPFEPKLYMSEIDQNVSKESKLNAKQIKYAFRSGLDYMLVAEFKKKFNVI